MTNKEKLWVSIIVILTVLLVFNYFNPPKTDNSYFEKINVLEKTISNKLDSIKNKEIKINVQQQDISSLVNTIKRLDNNLIQINAKLKKDTIITNTFNDHQLDSFFRARYGY